MGLGRGQAVRARLKKNLRAHGYNSLAIDVTKKELLFLLAGDGAYGLAQPPRRCNSTVVSLQLVKRQVHKNENV